MSHPRPSLATPCIGVCVIDSESDVCQGCRRTLEEIARWGGMSEAERLAVMARLPERGPRRKGP